MNDKRVHLLELFFRIVFQQMIVVFTQIDHAFDMGEQCRWLELAVGFFAQVEYRQACSQVLVIRSVVRDQVCGGLDNGFMNIGRLHPVVELDVGAQLDLRDRHVMQPFRRPIQHAMNFVEVNALCAAVTLRHQQTLIHVIFTCP